MDSQFIWNAILTIGMAVISALIALGARYLTQIQTALKDQIDSQDTRIKQIRDEYKEDLRTVICDTDATQADLNKFKVAVQRDFVNREEYIRTTQSLDTKIDKVLTEIGKINVNVAKLTVVKEGNPK